MRFPIPFKSLRVIRGGKEGPYVVGSLFTASYAAKADRLIASCEKYGLPYTVHEVPTVHASISEKGTDDIGYTKPNFIRKLLAEHKRPILFVDADCEFMAEPTLINEYVRTGCDFAVYNYCAD